MPISPHFGVITALYPQGFGFLVQETGPGDGELEDRIFFHACTVVGGVQFDDLKEGQGVDFLFGRDRQDRGPRARMVRARTGPIELSSRIYAKWQAVRARGKKA